MDDKVKKCIDILKSINESPSKTALINKFQNIVWNDDESINGKIGQILIDLAYDLDYFEPDEEVRVKTDEYFDESRMLIEINTALYKIRQITDI